GRLSRHGGPHQSAISTTLRPSSIVHRLLPGNRLPPGKRPSSIVHRPSSAAGKLAKRETIIGLLVLVTVVGYAIFDWQRVTVQSAAYREGATAEHARDWDKAASAFERAGDHRDANAKAH